MCSKIYTKLQNLDLFCVQILNTSVTDRIVFLCTAWFLHWRPLIGCIKTRFVVWTLRAWSWASVHHTFVCWPCFLTVPMALKLSFLLLLLFCLCRPVSMYCIFVNILRKDCHLQCDAVYFGRQYRISGYIFMMYLKLDLAVFLEAVLPVYRSTRRGIPEPVTCLCTSQPHTVFCTI
jgi:hypothetical protein